MEMVTEQSHPFTHIIAMRAAFRDQHGAAADALVAEIDQSLAARIVAGPLGRYGSDWYKGIIAPLQINIEAVAQLGKTPGDEIVELLNLATQTPDPPIRRDSTARPEGDSLLQFAVEAFRSASIKMRWKAIEAARKANDNGVKRLEPALVARFWDGRLIDTYIAGMLLGEKLLSVGWWELVSNLRIQTRAEIKAKSRGTAEIDDARFESQFISDATVRAAEAAEAPREPLSGGRQMSYPGGVRPAR